MRTAKGEGGKGVLSQETASAGISRAEKIKDERDEGLECRIEGQQDPRGRA